MASLIAWLLNPKNLLIVFLAAFLALTWFVSDSRKHKILEMETTAVKCDAEVRGLQAEISAANIVIESLKANLAAIKKQMLEWRRIAAEAEDYARRLLEATEAKVECEVYHEGNARLTDEFVDTFNGRLRRKVVRPADPSSAGPAEVLPAAPSADADKGNK